ncbi:MAG: 50S ribosomal protein L15e [Candidatus Micrarchaeota archaeon]|nr:50S ribosomal protein L15e [Candidatus Micrarchaeota archaeon]
MSSYKHIRSTIISQYKERPQEYREKLMKWGSEGTVTKVSRPTNLARARKLGYRAKQGVIVARVKVSKGKSKRRQPSGGRKPSKSGKYYTRSKSMQAIAEERATKKFSNAEVLNSYFVGDSGSHEYYEIIMLDRESPVVRADPLYSRAISRKNRAVLGLTASGRRHRGLM